MPARSSVCNGEQTSLPLGKGPDGNNERVAGYQPPRGLHMASLFKHKGLDEVLPKA